MSYGHAAELAANAAVAGSREAYFAALAARAKHRWDTIQATACPTCKVESGPCKNLDYSPGWTETTIHGNRFDLVPLGDWRDFLPKNAE